ncbi:phage adaptor protein [Methylobacter sp.]|uniref:phage adaptor protein n=1 Tax=Methylobacter sp. TaxID=2051955 RepID=UPI003DA3B0D5
MALTNYQELQDTIADWIHRTDLGTQIPVFIYLAERKISNNIRARELEIAGTTTTAVGVATVDLPTDYASLKNIQILGSPNSVLTLLPDDTILAYNANGSTGVPQFYSIAGNSILLSPIPDGEYTVSYTYYQDVVSLSSTNPTNWILTEYPYVYLYGALIEACVYTVDPDMVAFYQEKFDAAINDMWENSALESFSGSPLRAFSDYIV